MFSQETQIDTLNQLIPKRTKDVGSIGVSASLGDYFLDIHSVRRAKCLQYGINYQYERKYYSMVFFARYTRHTINDIWNHRISDKTTLDPYDNIVLFGNMRNIIDFFDFEIEIKQTPFTIGRFKPYLLLGAKGIINNDEKINYLFDESVHNFSTFGNNYEYGVALSVGAGISYQISQSWQINIHYDYTRNITKVNINNDTVYDRSLMNVGFRRKIH